METVLNLFITLVISCGTAIVIKLYFDDSGLGQFPVLTFLTVSVVSYMLISALELVVKL